MRNGMRNSKIGNIVLSFFFCLQCHGSLNPSEKQFAEFLESHKLSNPGKPLSERSLEELRAGTSVFMQYVGDAADVSYCDEQIPMSDGIPIAIRIYNNHLPDKTPVLIFYPGCAFIFDVFEINRIICSRIAFHSGIKVIMVHFRLAPESPLPTSIYDSYDATAYIAEHADRFGIDADKIFISGWCSGAHCAAAVSSLTSKQNQFKIFHQILLGGRYDLTESNHEFDEQEKEDKTVNRNLLRYLTEKYYGIANEDYKHPLMSPYYATDFQGFPSTTILCGEYDALRNDSEAYFAKLIKAGIEAKKVLLRGQTHNTIMMRKVLSDGPDPAKIIADIVKEHL